MERGLRKERAGQLIDAGLAPSATKECSAISEFPGNRKLNNFLFRNSQDGLRKALPLEGLILQLASKMEKDCTGT
ncbi:hypothetical protein LIER_34550 [Lithospermum erythrorhizon]|uniref:Uncharacterized protein n=1 Tax=Lithospermum erythrorhizon TaxID=34254 RepID=A0AAV3S3D8_LITER